MACCLVSQVTSTVLQQTGMERKDVNSKFWTKRGYNPHPSDVVLRTEAVLKFHPQSLQAGPVT